MNLTLKNTAIGLSRSYRTATLLDVSLTRAEGIGGEAQLTFGGHAISVSRVPGSSFYSINSDKLKRSMWSEPIATFFPAGTMMFARPTSSFDVTTVTVPTRCFDQILAGSPQEGMPLEFFITGADQLLIYSVKVLNALAFGTEPIDDPLLAETVLNAMARRIVANVAKITNKPEPVAPGGLGRSQAILVADYVDTNFRRQIRLQELASVAGVSLFHFSRAFRISAGVTPMQFVMTKRVEHAKQMLGRQRESLAEIALICGFSSQSHLSTAFREIAGMTPARYRTMHRARIYAVGALLAYEPAIETITRLANEAA